MNRIFIFLVTVCAVIFLSTSETFAAEIGQGKKILYIPIDNRPCNLKQVVEVGEKLGYEILTPPEEILGTGAADEKLGQPEKIWTWLEKNSAGTNAAVISTDAMIYGSLVGSRKHDLSMDEVMRRAKKFEDLRKNFPSLPIYAFSTIMRTPTLAGSSAEPAYYQKYGDMIYNYAALKDKSEFEKISRREKNQIAQFENDIPAEIMSDWFNRREKNYNANKYFVDLMSAGTFQFFLIGCDDNAKYSQTHLESRHLKEHGKNLSKTQFQVTAGADELGMILVSRAINKDLNEIPFVAVGYNDGVGENTIPSYSNEKIFDSIECAIIAAGGMRIPDAERADFVVAVNTNYDGKTFEASSPKNNIKPRKSTKNFMKLLNGYVEKNYSVGVADIATANGADNALMNQLRKNNLQFKISAYGGWNTATNTSGFMIGAGVLTRFLNEHEKNSLLLTRYFDDWVYQSNIRTQIANGLILSVPGEGSYPKLDGKRAGLEKLTAELTKKFAEENIIFPANTSAKNISANFIWNRCFECDFDFDF